MITHGMEHINGTKEQLLQSLIENRVFITGTGQVLTKIHPYFTCKDQDYACVVHSPSDHCMRKFPTLWRPKTASFEIGAPLMERICTHGIGHPDPDHMAWFASCHTVEQTKAHGVHGCDGCCTDEFEAVSGRSDTNECSECGCAIDSYSCPQCTPEFIPDTPYKGYDLGAPVLTGAESD